MADDWEFRPGESTKLLFNAFDLAEAVARFGYVCQECHEGTVRPMLFRDYDHGVKEDRCVVPLVVIGVCDKCAGRHYSGPEYKRWEAIRKGQSDD